MLRSAEGGDLALGVCSDRGVDRDGEPPSNGRSDSAGKGEKIMINRVQQLKVRAYKKR